MLLSASSRAAEQPDLERIINGIQTKYSRMRGLSADFTQIYRSLSGRAITESGRLIIKKPNKMRWDYFEPEKKLFVSDGKNIFFYVHADNQVMQSSVKETRDPRAPFLFLLRETNMRKEFSVITFAINERPVTAGNYVLLLVPRRAPEDFKEILLEVNPANFQIRRITKVEPSRARHDFLLSNIQENVVAPDSEFQFQIPSGARVLREDK